MTVEWWQFIVAILALIGTGLGMSIRFGYVVAETMSKTVDKITVETDAKIGRVFERFDKYKDQMETNFVRKESCQLTHNGTAQGITDLKQEIKRLNEKVDALLMRGQ